jgi:hypothetical protein
MTRSNAIQVVQVKVTPIDADRARLTVVADYDDAEKRGKSPTFDGLERLYGWNSTMGHHARVHSWDKMTYTRTRTRADGRKIDRHVLETEIPTAAVKDLQVAVVARTNVPEAKQDNAQELHQNYRPGYRLDPKRDYDGRFASVDDAKLVRDVTSLKSRKDIVAAYGDKTVGELRTAFGNKSVSRIRAMSAAERAPVLGAWWGTCGAQARAALAAAGIPLIS